MEINVHSCASRYKYISSSDVTIDNDVRERGREGGREVCGV